MFGEGRTLRVYSLKRLELNADGSACSKVSSSGRGLNASIQSHGPFGSNQEGRAIRRKCATGQR